jgi:signal transduction histidine kinase
MLAILIENIPDGVVLLNEDLEIVRANSAASQLLEDHIDIIDGSLTRISGRPVDELLDLPAGNPSGVIEVGGPEGKVLQVHGRRIRGDAFRGGVLVVRDTTMERRVAEQVQQHASLAAVGELAAGVAHDFNNVLQGIAVIAQALSDESSLSAQAKSDVATIVDQTTTGARVTRQLLDFSRQSPLTRRLVDLEEMLRDVCPLLERSLPANIAFTLDLPGIRIPVLADPALIQQLVANLVINARDAMPDGGHVDVRLSVLDPETDARVLPEVVMNGRWFDLRVTDSGCGMRPEVRARALEPFFTTKKRGAGTGLGLSQVYGIVQQHDGQLLISSHPGAGTTVSVLLPEHRDAAHKGD